MKSEKQFTLSHSNAFFVCTCCDKRKENREFLINHSHIYRARGRITVCNECVEELYDSFLDNQKLETEGNKIALYNICRQFDYMYSVSLYEGTVKQANRKGSGYLLMYLQKLGSLNQYRYKRFEDSDSSPQKSIVVSIEEDFELTKEIVMRWGNDLPIQDYMQLENFYQQMVETSGCEDPIKENILKNISKTQLKADKTLVDNNIQDYDRLVKAVSSMMKDGGITPSNQNKDDDGKAMIGMWTKMIEEEEPIPKPLSIYEDVDRLGHYVKKWFVQHFARVFGVISDNEVDYDKKYEEPSQDEDGGHEDTN